MDEIANRYVTALDELNLLMTASYYTAEGDPAGRSKQIADDLFSVLIRAYEQGIQDAEEMLEAVLAVRLDEMQDAIFARIDGKTFEDRVAEHVQSSSLGRLRTLAESEFHRVYNRALKDGGSACEKSGHPGVLKTWCTMLDNKVRDTHHYLEGVTIGVEDDFHTFDGDHAAEPGGFRRVENNAGCRCILRLHRKKF